MKWEGLREEYTWQVSEVAKNAEVFRERGRENRRLARQLGTHLLQLWIVF